MSRLTRADLLSDPIEQFRLWHDQARAASFREPSAMALSTVDPAGRPSSRMVLLKATDERGFVFSTNYQSRKATELERNPHAALLFYWDRLERQVRVEGQVRRADPADSDEIFGARPRGARLSAWASKQSREVADRSTLESSAASAEKRFGDDIPRPEHWGAYCLDPTRIEFWQGDTTRLHDRLCFVREPVGWRLLRLAP